MNCPHCNHEFDQLLADAPAVPERAPVLCGGCTEVSLLVNGEIRKPTPEELAQMKSSSQWADMVEPLQESIRRAKSARNN